MKVRSKREIENQIVGRSIWSGDGEILPPGAACYLGQMFAATEAIDQATRRLGEILGRNHALIQFLEAYWRLLMPVVALARRWTELSHLRTIPPTEMRAPDIEAQAAERMGIPAADVTCYHLPNSDEYLIRVSGAALARAKREGGKP